MKKETKVITCVGSSMAVGAFSVAAIYNTEFTIKFFFFLLVIPFMSLMVGSMMILLKHDE